MSLLKLPVLRPNNAIQLTLKRYIQGCYNPRICQRPSRPIIVTITGINTRSAQIAALLLKQSPLIDEIRLFDYSKGPCGIALDLSHIDTGCKVKSYTGLPKLKDAVKGAKIIVVCGGEATKAAHPEYELFNGNADYVRNIAIYASEFSPKAVLCIATPPITAMVPLVSEEYKKAQVYDSRRIVGITTLGMMRANSIIATYAGASPEGIMCPTVGGMGYKTTVAVVSQTDIGEKLTSPVADVLRSKIANAENHALQIKYIENGGPCVVTSGFATSRFVQSVARGLLDVFNGFECGFVRQAGETEDFLTYMCSVIKLGRHGVQAVYMPRIDNFECILLQRAANHIREQIAWGEAYVTGTAIKKKRRCKNAAPRCTIVTSEPTTKVGDVALDPTVQQVKNEGRLIPKTHFS